MSHIVRDLSQQDLGFVALSCLGFCAVLGHNVELHRLAILTSA
jgi:hypothetical protein